MKYLMSIDSNGEANFVHSRRQQFYADECAKVLAHINSVQHIAETNGGAIVLVESAHAAELGPAEGDAAEKAEQTAETPPPEGNYTEDSWTCGDAIVYTCPERGVRLSRFSDAKHRMSLNVEESKWLRDRLNAMYPAEAGMKTKPGSEPVFQLSQEDVDAMRATAKMIADSMQERQRERERMSAFIDKLTKWVEANPKIEIPPGVDMAASGA